MAQTATVILKSNHIFDSVRDEPFAGFVAVAGDTILAVGEGEAYAQYVGPDTRVADYGERMIMPGFIDSHGHLFFTMQIDNGVNLISSRSEEEAAQMVYAYAKTLPADMPVVMGYDYDPARWPYVYPTKASLDRLIPDRPVVIQRIEGHGCWLNSKALELFHLNRDTPDPKGGKYFRDEQGELTGYVDEYGQHYVSAMTTAALLNYGDFAKNWVKMMIERLNGWGVTSVSDMAFDYADPLRILEEIRAEGGLTLKFSLGLYASLLKGDWRIVHELQEKYTDPYLKYTTLKFMYDGSIMSNTAEMCEPYHDMPETCNLLPVDYEDMKAQMLRANAEGFRIRVHCIGDGAVKACLNIAEACRESGGNRGARFAIAHIECIHPEDIPRFRELEVIADIHPAHCTLGCDTAADNVYPKKVGPEREKYCFNYRSLWESGARLAAGSDSPAVIYNPMLGVYRGVTRRFGNDQPKDGWIPEQRLPLPVVLKAYTIGSAYLDYREEETGTLEAGKQADIIVLDQNLFGIDPSDILKTKVELTMVDGKICHGRLP